MVEVIIGRASIDKSVPPVILFCSNCHDVWVNPVTTVLLSWSRGKSCHHSDAVIE